MTAPLLNLPITASASPAGGQPVAGAAGAMGFEALMAAFFATGEAEAGATLPGEGEKVETTADAETLPADAAPTTPVDAQTLAALLAVTPQPAPTATPAIPEGQSEPVPAGAPPAAFSPLLAQEIATAPTTPVTDAEAAPVDTALAETPDTTVSAQPAHEGAGKPSDKPQASGLDKPREGQVTPAVEHAQAKGAPPAHAAAVQAAPSPAQPETAVNPLVQAEAAATEVEPLTEPVEEHAPAKPAKADAGRRNATTTGSVAAPAVPAVDASAVVPAVTADSETSGEPTPSIEGETIAAVAPRGAKTEAADTPEAQGPASTSATAHNAAGPIADAPLPMRGSPETVAQLAAQIVKKLEGRSTRFDVELNPAGLGQVNVAIEIGAEGKMTAALKFESVQAANELRGRAGELHKALEQAGFDLSGGGLSFDVAGDRGHGQGRGDLYQQQQQQNEGGAWRGRAFQAVLDTADGAAEAAAAAALHLQRRPTTGVDVRV